MEGWEEKDLETVSFPDRFLQPLCLSLQTVSFLSVSHLEKSVAQSHVGII